MKKQTKWIIAVCILLVCAALFVGLVLLPVGNNISLYWQIFTHPPGSQPQPWMLPKAEMSDIGQTVTISFPQLLKDSQYDDQDPLNPDRPEDVYIIYLESTNRLAVITEVENNHDWATLTVYEPDWSGTQNLFANRVKEFDAKIIHRQNVGWMEGTIYIENKILGTLKNDPTLAIDSDTYTTPSSMQSPCIYGRFSYDDSANISTAFLAYDLSKLTVQYDVFLRIVEKYGLSKHLGI